MKKSKYIILGEIDIQPLISAQDFLEEALQTAENKVEVAGVIQAFEVCYELSWKTLKKVLGVYGIEVLNPRDTFRLAVHHGLITNLKSWFDYIKKRNVTTHEYYDEIMEQVYPILPKFLKDLNLLVKNLKKIN